MERREVIFTGMVQGVGFRFTARAIARNHAVVGYVRNLADGRVRLVVEGQREENDRYVAQLKRRMADYILDADEATMAPTGDFDAFDVRF